MFRAKVFGNPQELLWVRGHFCLGSLLVIFCRELNLLVIQLFVIFPIGFLHSPMCSSPSRADPLDWEIWYLLFSRLDSSILQCVLHRQERTLMTGKCDLCYFPDCLALFMCPPLSSADPLDWEMWSLLFSRLIPLPNVYIILLLFLLLFVFCFVLCRKKKE